MSENDPYIKQLAIKADSFLAERNYKKAYEIYQLLAEKFPMSREVFKIKEKIDKEVQKENEIKINLKLKELKIFWKEKNYEQIIRQLKPYLVIAKNNKELNDQYLKAQIKYKEQIETNQKNFKKEQIKKLSILVKTDEKAFFMELYQLEKNNPGNKFIKNLVSDFRNQYIHDKLNKNKELFESEKFDVIEKVIENLKTVNKRNARLLELEREVKNRKFISQTTMKDESIYEGMTNLRTLIKLRKYSKAMKAAKEIIRADNKNKEALKILKIAEKGYEKQIREQTINLIISKIPEIKKDYRNNRNNYLKI